MNIIYPFQEAAATDEHRMPGDVWLYGFVFFEVVGYGLYFVILKKESIVVL